MIFPLIALAAPIAALNAQAAVEIPALVTNNQETAILAHFSNQEPEALSIKALTLSLRTPKKDHRKTYANYSVPVEALVESGQQLTLPIPRTFSLPTKEFDVLLDFEISETETRIATPPVTVKFQDQPIGFLAPQFLASLAVLLAFIATLGFFLAAIVRPDLLEKYIFAEAPKPKQQKPLERARTPDEPDAWLPAKHKKKSS